MIPDEPLKITFDPATATLDELCLFSPRGFDPVVFRQFLIDRSNWTIAQIGNLRGAELQTVAQEIADQIARTSVPLGNAPRSKIGRVAKRGPSPRGSKS